jgi:hypothetical protein
MAGSTTHVIGTSPHTASGWASNRSLPSPLLLLIADAVQRQVQQPARALLTNSVMSSEEHARLEHEKKEAKQVAKEKRATETL